MQRRQDRSPVPFLFFLLAMAMPAAGADRKTPPTVYLVLRAQSGSDASFRAVLASTLRLQLALRGTAMVLAETSDLDASGREAPFAAARSHGAAWLMDGSYANSGDAISLRFELFDAESGRSLGSASGEGRLNLSLDALIVQVIEKALAGLRPIEAPGMNAPGAGTGDSEAPAAATEPAASPKPQPMAVGTLAAAGTEAPAAGRAAAQSLSPTLESLPSPAAPRADRRETLAVAMVPGEGVPEISGAAIPTLRESPAAGRNEAMVAPEAAPEAAPEIAMRAVPDAGTDAKAVLGTAPTAMPEAALEAAPEVAVKAGPAAATAGEKAAPPAAPEAAPEAATPERTASAASGTGPWRLFGISAGAAPFLAVGSVSDFTKIGVWSTLAVDLRFRLAGAVLEAGILSGFCWFRAQGDVSSVDVYLVPIGPDLRFTPAAGAGPAVMFHLSGGPAIMTTVTSYLGTFTEAVPYVLGGIAMDLPLAPFFSLRIEAEYAVFFEEFARPIMGFVPGASLAFRF